MEIQNLKKIFIDMYGKGDIRVFHSPGRVNLIGEHIDYNGGLVFPCALNLGTYGLVRKREDSAINLASTNFNHRVSVNLEGLCYKEEYQWGNYMLGVLDEMHKLGHALGGMDILICGNIPNGAGLSSSASIEVLTAVMVNNLFNQGKIDRIELVKVSQKAENNFVGVNCGVMDQFAVGMGREDKAILLNCSNLDYYYAEMDLADNVIVIMNTNKRRVLNESKYNERRLECEKALELLRAHRKIDNLCELSPKEFESLCNCIEDETIRKRAEHVICENQRVKFAFDSLKNGDLMEFGRLLEASHRSLKDLYEVTGNELDIIVEEALNSKGCIGARMTGAGFGGCALAVVKKVCLDSFIHQVSANYMHRTSLAADFYVSGIGEGTKEL